MSMASPKYSLLVPVRNEAGRIEAVVRALFEDLATLADHGSIWEILIADDASDDGTYERLLSLSERFPFRLLRPAANLGRGAIRNRLAEEAAAECLIFLDGDCRPQPGFFRAWENLGPDTAWVGRISYETHPPSGFSRFLAQGSGVAKRPRADAVPPAYFASANFRVSKAAFRQAGGFRTDLPGWGGEDVDLGLKLARLGVPLRYRPEAEARHPAVTDLEAYFARLSKFGRTNLPLLLAADPSLEIQFKLRFARAPWSLLFLNPALFALCHALITIFRGRPWPFAFYRYVIFNCYARGYRQGQTRRNR
jgi:glycosyltransferase involved in cell wall biosynthesis